LPTPTKTILLTDDRESARGLYQELLSDAGYRVLLAENGVKALEWLGREPVDLLLTDVIMPDMNAIELLPKVRDLFPRLPIVVYSAFKETESAIDLEKLGIAAFLLKPIDPQILLDIVRNALGD